jgi:hypothetical protein
LLGAWRSNRRSPRLGRVAFPWLALTVAAALSGCSAGTAPAVSVQSHTGPETIFEAEAQLHADPAGTLEEMQRLGADIVRVYLPWSAIAPDPSSRVPPTGFDASNPAAYPQASWSLYDAIVRDARSRGIRVDLTIGSPAPMWAVGPGAPPGAPAGGAEWKPSASAYGAFVRAVASRYSGRFTPPGGGSPLPRVDFWSIWNEPNYGPDLAPQAIDGSTVEVSPLLYRNLVDAAWSALNATGHDPATDTILIGELAPRGITVGDNPGNFSGMVPLRFLRALYCVGSSYRPLRGSAATARGCPSDAAGSAAFPRMHPALFHASGIADHPYPEGVPPNVRTPEEPDYADLASIPELEQTLDTLQRVYRSDARFPIYDTEFGYQTNPPETIYRAISPPLAAYYLNWAEYIHYQDPRIRTYDQYLLSDSPTASFATGLEYANGAPKASFYAFRMPLYMPSTSASPGTSLVVWGCARPADVAAKQTGKPQRVALQFQTRSKGPFKTIRTITLTDPNAYFDVLQSFRQSGLLRSSWQYPGGETIYSRTVALTIH